MKLRVWKELDGYHTYIHVRYDGSEREAGKGMQGQGDASHSIPAEVRWVVVTERGGRDWGG